MWVVLDMGVVPPQVFGSWVTHDEADSWAEQELGEHYAVCLVERPRSATSQNVDEGGEG